MCSEPEASQIKLRFGVSQQEFMSHGDKNPPPERLTGAHAPSKLRCIGGESVSKPSLALRLSCGEASRLTLLLTLQPDSCLDTTWSPASLPRMTSIKVTISEHCASKHLAQE